MATFPFQPERFVIEAISTLPQNPAVESYTVRTQLRSGRWTMGFTSLAGLYEVRLFLNDKGIENKKIALAIEELSQRRRVQVNCGAGELVA
jgi:hypothetical protein